MKARHEFETQEAYEDYLRAYYAGLILTAHLPNVTVHIPLVVEESIELANELIRQLNEQRK